MDATLREIWMALAPWPEAQARMLELVPPAAIESLGVQFLVYPQDNYTEFRIWRDGLPPEHEPTTLLADRLAGQNATLVDVGANAGAFSLPILTRLGAAGRGLLFEPNPDMRARLRANIARNSLPRTDVRACAVSDRPGQARMHFPKVRNLGQGRIDVDYGDMTRTGDFEVDVRTLPDCLTDAGIDRIDLLKVDVEGLEDRVICPLLDGNPALHPALLYFEVAHDHLWSRPLRETLAQHGYRVLQRFGPNTLFGLPGTAWPEAG